MGNSSVVSIRVEALGVSITIADGSIAIEQTKTELPAAAVPKVESRAVAISKAGESVDNHGDGRSPQVDLVRRGRAVPVAAALQTDSRPSASAQCAEA
jgi:hypothetical protein